MEDIRYNWNRQQNISYNLAREREERSVSASRHQSPQHHQTSPIISPRTNQTTNSPFIKNTAVGTPNRRFPSATAFKPAPQPQSLPAQLRRPVQPIALKYAKPGETAPLSVTQFMEEQREGSFDRPATEIKPEVHSPEREKIHEPRGSDVNDAVSDPEGMLLMTSMTAKPSTTKEEEQEDDEPVLAAI